MWRHCKGVASTLLLNKASHPCMKTDFHISRTFQTYVYLQCSWLRRGRSAWTPIRTRCSPASTPPSQRSSRSVPCTVKKGCTKSVGTLYTVKEVSDFLVPGRDVTKKTLPGPGIIELFLARESLVIDIPAGDGKTANLFFTVCPHGFGLFSKFSSRMRIRVEKFL